MGAVLIVGTIGVALTITGAADGVLDEPRGASESEVATDAGDVASDPTGPAAGAGPSTTDSDDRNEEDGSTQAPPSVEVPLSRAPDDPAALAEDVRNRTVRVECARGLGSGWPIDPTSLGAPAVTEGSLIVTNAHVVEDCGGDPTVVVGGRSHPGRIIGVDFSQPVGDLPPERDLALIRTTLVLEPFRVGPDVRIGHWVMAVGSPMGIDGTVTFGVVSNFLGGTILTNTDIFQGNSGGPLVNARGDVVGVNTAYFREYESLAIAVDARRLCARLLECG